MDAKEEQDSQRLKRRRATKADSLADEIKGSCEISGSRQRSIRKREAVEVAESSSTSVDMEESTTPARRNSSISGRRRGKRRREAVNQRSNDQESKPEHDAHQEQDISETVEINPEESDPSPITRLRRSARNQSPDSEEMTRSDRPSRQAAKQALTKIIGKDVEEPVKRENITDPLDKPEPEENEEETSQTKSTVKKRGRGRPRKHPQPNATQLVGRSKRRRRDTGASDGGSNDDARCKIDSTESVKMEDSSAEVSASQKRGRRRQRRACKDKNGLSASEDVSDQSKRRKVDGKDNENEQAETEKEETETQPVQEKNTGCQDSNRGGELEVQKTNGRRQRKRNKSYVAASEGKEQSYSRRNKRRDSASSDHETQRPESEAESVVDSEDQDGGRRLRGVMGTSRLARTSEEGNDARESDDATTTQSESEEPEHGSEQTGPRRRGRRVRLQPGRASRRKAADRIVTVVLSEEAQPVDEQEVDGGDDATDVKESPMHSPPDQSLAATDKRFETKTEEIDQNPAVEEAEISPDITPDQREAVASIESPVQEEDPHAVSPSSDHQHVESDERPTPQLNTESRHNDPKLATVDGVSETIGNGSEALCDDAREEENRVTEHVSSSDGENVVAADPGAPKEIRIAPHSASSDAKASTRRDRARKLFTGLHSSPTPTQAVAAQLTHSAQATCEEPSDEHHISCNEIDNGMTAEATGKANPVTSSPTLQPTQPAITPSDESLDSSPSEGIDHADVSATTALPTSPDNKPSRDSDDSFLDKPLETLLNTSFGEQREAPKKRGRSVRFEASTVSPIPSASSHSSAAPSASSVLSLLQRTSTGGSGNIRLSTSSTSSSNSSSSKLEFIRQKYRAKNRDGSGSSAASLVDNRRSHGMSTSSCHSGDLPGRDSMSRAENNADSSIRSAQATLQRAREKRLEIEKREAEWKKKEQEQVAAKRRKEAERRRLREEKERERQAKIAAVEKESDRRINELRKKAKGFPEKINKRQKTDVEPEVPSKLDQEWARLEAEKKRIEQQRAELEREKSEMAEKSRREREKEENRVRRQNITPQLSRSSASALPSSPLKSSNKRGREEIAFPSEAATILHKAAQIEEDETRERATTPPRSRQTDQSKKTPRSPLATSSVGQLDAHQKHDSLIARMQHDVKHHNDSSLRSNVNLGNSSPLVVQATNRAHQLRSQQEAFVATQNRPAVLNITSVSSDNTFMPKVTFPRSPKVVTPKRDCQEPSSPQSYPITPQTNR